MNTRIRWLIRCDLPAVLKIEQASFELPWTEEDFLCYLRRRSCVGMVAERGDEILGFLLYERYPEWLRILNVAVHPRNRRQGAARELIEHLKTKLSRRRREAVLHIRETNLPAQLFFRACGFRGTGVLPNYYDHPREDAFVLRYRFGGVHPDDFSGKNRIAECFETEV
jgi:[ribosomal protein S18]-alanine N-acetyltransferase